jgi:hypothetical protein
MNFKFKDNISYRHNLILIDMRVQIQGTSFSIVSIEGVFFVLAFMCQCVESLSQLMHFILLIKMSGLCFYLKSVDRSEPKMID